VSKTLSIKGNLSDEPSQKADSKINSYYILIDSDEDGKLLIIVILIS
jgi:hypothetical protein